MSWMAVSADSELFARSIRRRSARIARSLSLIAQRRTKTWASWKELMRTGLPRRGRQASNSRAIRTSFMRPPVWPGSPGCAVGSRPPAFRLDPMTAAPLESRKIASTSNQARPLALSSAEEIDRKAGPAHEGVARLLDRAEHARHVDSHQVAPPLPHLSGDEDGLDMAGVHEVHDRPGCVVERPHVDAVGPQHDDVGVLAGGQRADLVVEVGAARALDRGALEHVPAG